MNDSQQPNPTKSDHSRNPVIVLCYGTFGTLICSLVTFGVAMVIAPRMNEGVREVVTWPWEPYAIAVFAIPIVLIHILGLLLFSKRAERISILILAITTQTAWFLVVNLNLLRRDYIGKF